ncbi:MAG: HEPN domain-containing protein [Deltaproteobacteria bacterium]|nr:HEPN domain-containing protein [Deltaproteobacteria bacterium]
MKPEVQEYLKKADRALKVAENLLTTGFEAEAAAKAYYAMFYAAQALLKENGIQRVKHSAVQAAFGQHLVKTGKIDAKFHRMLIDARETRELADYTVGEEVSAETAILRVKNAEEFIQIVKTLIAQAGE